MGRTELLALIIEKECSDASSERVWPEIENIVPVYVSNGVEALLWLGKGNIPDVILADASMEQMSGIDFIRTIRSSGFFQEIPVLVFGQPEYHPQIAGMRQAGSNDHLFLPATAVSFQSRIEKLVAGRRNTIRQIAVG